MIHANPYALLDVSQDATDEQIRAAYFRQARLLHPDRNKAPNAGAQFNAAHDAYKLLSNPRQRFALDHGMPLNAEGDVLLSEDEVREGNDKVLQCELKGSLLQLRALLPPPLSAFACGLLRPHPSRRLCRRIERFVSAYGPSYTGPRAASVHTRAREVVGGLERLYDRQFWPDNN